jgi:hypothetical protein
MKMLFDTDGAPPPEKKTYGLLPAGEYLVKVISEQQKTFEGGKEVVTLTLEVQDGEYRGRRIWDDFRVKGYSPVAHQISKTRWESLEQATGPLGDSSDAIGHLAYVQVRHEEYNGKKNVRAEGYRQAETASDAVDDPLPF